MIFTPLKAKAMIFPLIAAFTVGASLSLAVMKLRLDEQRSRHEVALKEKDRLYVQDMAALRYEHDIAATKVANEARVQQDAITTRYENALNDAQVRQAALRTDLNRARAASVGLREQARRLALRASQCTSYSGTTQSGDAAGQPAVVLADLLSRADARAGELARAYDRARASGLACERAYHSLISQQ